jgi:hypothetical protein
LKAKKLGKLPHPGSRGCGLDHRIFNQASLYQ